MFVRSLLGIVFALYSMSVLAKVMTHPQEPWRVYVNKEYHFTLKYPPTRITSKQFSGAYLLGRGWSANNSSSLNNASQHSIWQAQLQNAHGRDKRGDAYYYQSYVRVGVSTFARDITACQKNPNDTHAHPASITTMINNKKFYVSAFADAGMSQYYLGTSYRRIENNKCYSVEYIETGTNNIPHHLLMTKKNRELAKKIINTFVFLAPHPSKQG
jgi:hypothetical protein